VAYLNFLIAATDADVLALSRDVSLLLEPSLVVPVSHLIASWVEVQPLGKLLGQAVDGGLTVSSELWHPLRPPVYHNADAAKALYAQLAEEWQRVVAERAVPEDDWFRIEIEKVLRLFRHASDRSESIVSVLERPADQERAHRVQIPFTRSRG
jgi:hypothetical protein